MENEMKAFAIFASLLLAAGVAEADDFDQSAAWGIARIISLADRCKFEIDQTQMQKHLEKIGLNNAAALGFITLVVQNDAIAGKSATEAECTVVRGTAQSLGITK